VGAINAQAFDHVMPVGSCINDAHPYLNMADITVPVRKWLLGKERSTRVFAQTFDQYVAGTKGYAAPSPTVKACDFPLVSVAPVGSANATKSPTGPPIVTTSTTTQVWTTSAVATTDRGRPSATTDTRSGAPRGVSGLWVGILLSGLTALAAL
jgi:hypothetical protein